MAHSGFSLQRDAFGRLLLIDADGGRHEGVVPVRAFPIAAPDEGISLLSGDGHEVGWTDRLSELPEAEKALIEEELAGREFMPVIDAIVEVSSFACPSTWQLRTDRGPAELLLKGEEDIRRLPGGRLLIADSHGIQFLIRDVAALDRHSRRLLDRFL
jgi:hypothetical protein